MATSFSQIKTALGSPPGVIRDSILLSDYYNTSTKAGYWIANVPSSGPIAVSNLAGKTPAIELTDNMSNQTKILFDGIELKNKGGGTTNTSITNSGATLNVTVGGYPATRIGSTNAATPGAYLNPGEIINSNTVFTIECKLYINTIRNEDVFLSTSGDFLNPNSTDLGIRVYQDKIEFIFSGKRSIINTSYTLTQLQNQWLALAWSRDANNYVRAFLNGQIVSNTQLSGPIGGNLLLGRLNYTVTCDAYVRQFRYTNNVRYTTNYNPYEFLVGSLVP